MRAKFLASKSSMFSIGVDPNYLRNGERIHSVEWFRIVTCLTSWTLVTLPMLKGEDTDKGSIQR